MRALQVASGLTALFGRLPAAPAISGIPAPRQTVTLGSRLELRAEVSAAPSASFHWSRNGRAIAGANSATCVIAQASARDNGSYRLTVADATGRTESAVVFVNVVVPAAHLTDAGVSGSQAPVAPSGTRPLVAVAAGRAHGLALRDDGTVMAWGSNAHGESSVPAGLSEVVAVAASEAQSLALRADGSVVAWGSNNSGEAVVPAGLANVVALAAGGHQALALRADGRVVAWGSGAGGATNVPASLPDAVAIATSPLLSLALDASGTLSAWGESLAVPAAAGNGPFAGVAAGGYYGVAWRADGTVVTCPRINVRLGNPDPSNLTGVTEVAVAGNIGIAVRADGTVTGWNATGPVLSGGGGTVIINPFPPDSLLPSGIPLSSVVSAAAGQGHVVLLRDGSRDVPPSIQSQPGNLTANEGGAAGLRVDATSTIAMRYQWYRDGVPLDGATAASLTLRNVVPAQAGAYTVTISSEFGSVTSSPARLTVFPLAKVVAASPVRQIVRLGGRLSLGVTVTNSDGTKLQWRRNGIAIAGATSATYPIEQATRADAGWYQAEVVNAAGPAYSPTLFVVVALEQARLVAWGPAAALGLPATITDVADLGYDLTMGAHFLRGDGTVTAFGGAAIPPLTDVVRLAATTAQRAALQSDGTVTYWRPGSIATVIDTHTVQISLGPFALSVVRADGSVKSYDVSTGRFSAEGSNVARTTAHGVVLRRDGAFELVDQNLRTLQRYSLPVPADDLVEIGVDASTGPLALANDGRLFLASPTLTGERRIARLPGGGTGLAVIPSISNPNLVLNRNGTLVADPTGSVFPANLVRVVFSAGTPDSGIAVIDASTETVPSLVNSPASATIGSGGAVRLSGAVTGTGTGVSYQWSMNGAPVPNATLPTLTLRGVTSAHAGRYTLSATNARGTTTSAPATLTVVLTPTPGRLANLSVRAAAGTGAQMLIVGFVVGGAPTAPARPLLLRAVGPALQNFGVRDALPDPLLRVYAGDTVFTSNDNWSGSLGDVAAAYFGGQVGAFPLPDAFAFDSALVTQVHPGAYSMQITAASGASGVALAEVYDAAPGAFDAAARLVNLSTRATAGAGDGTLIVGFAIAGASPCTLLLRAVGPGLAPFGVTGTLPDPRLDLFSGSSVIGVNDNWNSSVAIAAAAARVGAFGLNPASPDSALLVTLPPGAYTVQVSGAGGTSGVVLVEVYEAP